MSVFRNLVELLLPANCLYCELAPKPICDNCAARFDGRVREVSRGGLSGLALFEFSEDASAAISAFKEHGQFALANQLVDRLVTPAVLVRLKEFGADVLVAMPSAPKSFAKRGFSPAEVVALALARHARLPVQRGALRLTRTTQDQAALGIAGRAENLVGAMTASSALANRRVLIVDDIVTTGASVIEAARATEQAGAEVVGFFSLAETILRNAAQSSK